VGAKGSPEFMGRETSSFTDFVTAYAPDLLPGAGLRTAGAAGPGADLIGDLPHGTTLIAAICDHGVVLAGDRRATSGSMISHRDIEKVFRSDEYSAIGIAGTASLGLDFVRLFQVELEHYEKMEGRPLSLDGKANRLATIIRGNLMAAMQGLVVIPLFVGYDEETGQGRIFGYDVAGGPYEEHRFLSVGSGSVFARGALKKLYADGMSVRDTVLACVHALYDAADDDSATGGPDLPRRIFPVVTTVTADGFRRLTDAESEEYARQVVESRLTTPDGPVAQLRSNN
jgi:proteasome beta subunit